MRVRALLGVLMAGALVFAACGDDSGTGTNPTTTEGGGNGTGTTSGGSDTTINIDDLNDVFGGDCGAAGAFLAAGFASLYSGSGDTDINQFVDQFESFADNAPDEIKDDVQLIAQAYAEVRQALDDAGIDLSDPTTFSDPAKLAQLSELSDQFDTLNSAEFEAAGERVSTYFEENCSSG